MPNKPNFVIAIDGPSASGKGTLAKRLAQHFNAAYLETGLLYRAVGLKMMQEHGGFNEPAAIEVAQNFDHSDQALFEHTDIRIPKVSSAASQVAAIPAVREALLQYQRDYALKPPAGKEGAVLDGRDIGSFVCPEAHAKLYMVADVEVRARRRTDELLAQKVDTSYAEVLERLKDRDHRDSTRAQAPLQKTDDALEIDSTQMTLDEVFEKAVAFIQQQITL